jgi:transcriptional regulator with XRE-family HTH domain
MGKALDRLKKRKKALSKLADIFNQSEHVVVVHYSCESFYDRPQGASPRITSIAALNLETRQARSFSIHQIAERTGVNYTEIESHYNELERRTLDEFYNYVNTHLDCIWLHWNMRNINYGFEAIAHRYKVLSGQPIEIHDSNLVDLSNLLIWIYGVKYIHHPRLPNLIEKNRISHREFLTGEEEARAFEDKDYVKLHQSTLRKVDILASIAERTADGSLKTIAKISDIYGGYFIAFSEFIKENWIIALISLISAILGIIAIFIK